VIQIGGDGDRTDFIFGDLQHAMRKQLFDGIATIADAIDLSTLPDNPAFAV